MSGVLVLLAALLLAVPEAKACECPQKPSSDKAALKEADRVFSGTVLSSTPSADGTEQVHRFEVSRLYKGDLQRVTEVVSKGGKSCGFPFEPGKSYLVFSTGHSPMTATTCDGTRVLAQASAKLPTLKSAPCALALEPPLGQTAKAATRMLKKDFSQHPPAMSGFIARRMGVYRSRRIPAEQLPMVRDVVEAQIVVSGKTGKIEHALVGL